MKVKTFAVAVAAVLAAASAQAAVKDFTVNGVAVKAAQQEAILQRLVQQGAKRDAKLEDTVKRDLVTQIALQQAAIKSGVDKEQQVQAAINNARTNIITDAFISKYLQANPPSEADARKIYDHDKAAYGPTEYHLRHFTTRTQAEAQKALDRVKTGEAFDKVASEVTLDQGSKARGGDIGWHSPVTVFPSVGSQIASVKAGQTVSAPIAIPGGFDVFQVVATRPAHFPEFDKVKNQYMRSAARLKANEYIKSIADKAVVK
ncbi:peptidyl-prolyl cis-trans isomerase [Mesosutterella sp. OilRF-GAM-744-9]|uniref:peptidylprolyl isomerase n=1 Tax=Mesosutterella porci TaxID=2915351 RepID=A0ABS9MRP1_9BURK|nr:peptidyl-prolyl cis-trans isomerase [Mesosutterella sp. oilRF-744-WT-GAM-9]MCG5031042.1 peptidyl-prolyl cis-trans isomerase [Mesosutterella sp. oilRF-744-WT-GAM-9]